MVRFYIFTAIVFFYVLQGHFSGLSVSSDGLVGDVPMALMKFILSMFFFVNGIRYVVLWEGVNPDSVLLKIVRNVVVPTVTLFWMFKYNLLLVFSHNVIGLLALFPFAFYLLSRKKIIEFVGEKMPINDYDARFFFKSYPPRNRSDLLGVDIFMFLMWSLPLIFTIE